MSASPITEYISFWTKYYKVCKDHRLDVAPFSLPFEVIPYDNDFLIKLKEPIHLQDWQENASSSRKIDILVYGSEIIDAKSVILKSTVSVNYFDKPKKNVLRLLESIHYDYAKPEAGHPIFHAQISSDVIPERNSSDSFKRFQVDPINLKDRLKGIRIPTAHVGLICVLVALIADHTERRDEERIVDGKKRAVKIAPVLEKIIKETGKSIRSPKPRCNKLHKMITNEAFSFRSILWYPECT